MSEDTRTIVAILLLLFAYPVGFIFMLGWTNWSKGVKWLVSIPLIISILAFIIFILGILFYARTARTDPYIPTSKQLDEVGRKAICLQKCGLDTKDTACINTCMNNPTAPAQ